jgi:hypothetical protein
MRKEGESALEMVTCRFPERSPVRVVCTGGAWWVWTSVSVKAVGEILSRWNHLSQ